MEYFPYLIAMLCYTTTVKFYFEIDIRIIHSLARIGECIWPNFSCLST